MRVYKLQDSDDGGPTFALPCNCLDAIMDTIEQAEVGCVITVKVVEMTEAEFDALPEY